MTHSPQQTPVPEDVEVRRKKALALAEEDEPTAIPPLDTLLGDPNWRVRKAAVESLLTHAPEATLPTLLAALYDSENAGKRNSALEVLIKLGPQVLPHVYDQLVTGDEDVKLALVTLLGSIPSKTSIPHLIYYLSHENKNIVSAAITSLGQLKDSGSLALLFDIFRRRDDWLWFHLIDALSNIGGPSATGKLMELYDLPKYRKAVLKSFGRTGDLQAVPFLLEKAGDSEAPLLDILDALGRIYNASLPEAMVGRHQKEVRRLIRQHFPMGPLEQMMEAWPEAKVTERRGMILVAGCLADLSLLDHLLSELETAYLQKDAYEAATAYGRAACPAIVEKLSQPPRLEQRVLLIRLLGATGDPQAIPTLLLQAGDDDVQVRMEALAALGEVNDPQGLEALIAVLKEPDATFHETALRAIQNLSRRHPAVRAQVKTLGAKMVEEPEGSQRRAGYALLAEGLGPDVRPLLPGLKDPSPAVRQTVVRLIASKQGTEAFETLLPMLGDEDGKVRRVAVSVLGRELLARQPDALMTALADPDIWVRAETAFFLAQSTDPTIAQALLGCLKKDTLPVQLDALKGLAEIGCGTLFQEVQNLATSTENGVEVRQAALTALAKSGRPDAVRILTEALSDHVSEIHRTAIQLMGSSQDHRYIPLLLRELEKSPDPEVKKTVVQALIALKAIEAVPRMLNYLTDPILKDAAFAFFTSLGREHIKLIENEAQSVDFQTKLILIEILKHLENL